MRIGIALILLITSKYIECQIVLTRDLLEEWYGADELAKKESLYLRGRGITSIDPQTFNGLINLQTIELYNNLLTEIDSETFKGLINLYSLSLFTNQISRIDPKAFKIPRNLKFI